MTTPIEELWSMPEPALLGAYHGARRQFVEKKFARDTQRARLEWLKANARFACSQIRRKIYSHPSQELTDTVSVDVVLREAEQLLSLAVKALY